MKIKIVLIVLVAFVAIPVLTDENSPSSKLEEKNIRFGAFDQLVDVAEQILVFVSKAVDEAIEEIALGIRELLKAIDFLQEEALKTANATVEKEVQIINELIEHLKVQIDEVANQEILECMKDNQQQVSQLQDEASDYALSCIDAAVQKVGNGTLTILIGVESWNEEFIKVEQNLDDCKIDDLPLNCVKNLINRLLELALTLPVKVQQDADKVQSDYDQLKFTVQECVSEAFVLVKEEGAQIYNNITRCVIDSDDFTLWDEYD